MENEIIVANAVHTMTEVINEFIAIDKGFTQVANAYLKIIKGEEVQKNGLIFTTNINFLRVESIKLIINKFENMKSEFNFEELKPLIKQFEFEANKQLKSATDNYIEILKMQ
ncbi:MAG TPA: hypothetical protein VIH86_00465 [Puia sp.]